ncbi:MULTISPECIES: Dps family protein [Paenibacillus]|jgi:starvation-inducible DNA-binding protein|uniref:Dps family protein n=1 Tax=Paenibacillus TaxID=44249 RepID=UPI00073E3B00|nr:MULTISPECIES: DNA starvation/stationary phase protection protein [Paenibacillus]MDU4696074.1 DNA starvation/stationary phase protection protein [Paenibacillus sp.]
MANSEAKSTGKTKKSSLEQLLNEQVANLNVLYVKLHNYHWYVKGSNFFRLHVKFEELYNEVSEQMDAIAERMLTLKWNPSATLKEYLELATIQEAVGKEEPQAMVQHVLEDLATLTEAYQEGITLADQAEDPATSDLLTGYVGSLEKHMWMLRAFLD